MNVIAARLGRSQKLKSILSPPWWRARMRRASMPRATSQYLRTSNPRLKELRRRYAALNYFEHSIWGEQTERFDLRDFRGEGPYVAQVDYWRTKKKFMVTAGYVAAADSGNFQERLNEDGVFGAVTFELPDGRVISRDLLDSVLEISFLTQHLALAPDSSVSVLDIGAGYGRLAHRFLTLFPKANFACVDAIPESTFLCEFYTRFRHLGDRCDVVPLDNLAQLNGRAFDLATNIHSWSECPISAVHFWMDHVADLRIPRLLVIPNGSADGEGRLVSLEKDGTRRPFEQEIEKRGYRRVATRHKFGESPVLLRNGLFSTRYFLYERSS